jgi:hypothetical protein
MFGYNVYELNKPCENLKPYKMKKLYMILTLILVSTGAFAQNAYQQREADNAAWQARQREIARQQAIENEAWQAAQGGGLYVTPVTQPVVVAQPRAVVVTPQPVVVAPRPVVIGPRPVVVPRPVVAPRVYYYAPVPPPVVVPVYPAVVPAPRAVVEAAVVASAVTGPVVTGMVFADLIKSGKEAKRARKAAEATKAASVRTVEAEAPSTTAAPARAAQKRAGISADND